MRLDVLPTRTAGAAENMAVDFLLLQRYPQPAAPRFRHYEWRGPAFTFGYAQKVAWVREQLSGFVGEEAPRLDVCRRPTGGGIVDHREDWTYALVIPRGHAMEDLRATHSYQAIHDALAAALRDQGVDADLKRGEAELDPNAGDDGPGGVCFQRAEVFDVVHARTGEKIAGAAQKRNKHGLLFQGSIWRPAAGAGVDWDVFADAFSAGIATRLGGEADSVPWPEFNEDELAGLTEQYSSPEWIERR